MNQLHYVDDTNNSFLEVRNKMLQMPYLKKVKLNFYYERLFYLFHVLLTFVDFKTTETCVG